MLLQNLLNSSTTEHGRKPAVVWGKKRFSYEDVLLAASTVASYLAKNDFRKGERVVILTDDPFYYISCYFGIVMVGGIIVGLNTQTSERSLAFYLGDCSPAFVLVSGRSLKYRNAMGAIIADNQIVDIRLIIDNPENDVLSGKKDNIVQEDEPAQIIYTSGTTGKPKGVVLSHKNLVSNTVSTVEYLGLTANDSVMVVLPFFYSYGNSVLLTHIAAGGTLVVNQNFVYPNVILDQMVEERVTGLAGVPSTFALLLHRSALRDYTFNALRYLTQAGAAMSPALAGQLREVFSGADIFIMYGQTEAAPRLTYLPPNELEGHPGSIGRAIPGVTIEILEEDGTPVEDGEIGEIVATGDNIMVEYWQRPAETEVVLRDGKLWTGDLAYADSDGFFYIVSRKSDMIKSGSHRIAPKEIEEIVEEIPDVVEVAVVGDDDEILGESIHAYVVSSPDSDLTDRQIIKYCRKNLPAFKVPHKVSIIDQLPKGETGKILKTHLKQ